MSRIIAGVAFCPLKNYIIPVVPNSPDDSNNLFKSIVESFIKP